MSHSGASSSLTSSSAFLQAWAVWAVWAAFVIGSAAQQTREIVSGDFTKNRPVSASKSGTSSGGSRRHGRSSGGSPGKSSVNAKRYRLASSPTPGSALTSTRLNYEQLGVTLWKLRPAKASDTGERMLLWERENSSQWIPERTEADTPLREGDRVRLSIESPRAGYLYVFDRDLLADGSKSRALLIFPWPGADNRARAGKVIDIPALDDQPNHFIAHPARDNQAGELLTIIVTNAPLNLGMSDKPIPIATSALTKWEEAWGTESERFEMTDGAGLAWTKAEKDAAVTKGTRRLTRDDAAPQTIYRFTMKNRSAFLVNVQLKYLR